MAHAGALGERCRVTGIRRSMGAVGDCFDKARAARFVATRECEILARAAFRTHREACTALFAYIASFCNRRHAAPRRRTPDAFERGYTHQQAVA